MNNLVRWASNDRYDSNGVRPSRRLPVFAFLMRYPLFLLAFGPPIFRSQAGIDATKGQIDIWAFLQVIWLGIVAFRAIRRLTRTESILIPRQIRSILLIALILGLLFLASAAYSPSRPVSVAYSILYFVTLMCVMEFIVDVYHNPPDWMQCIFQLRLIALLLFALVILTIPFNPSLVLVGGVGGGMRILGYAVAPLPVICPMIALISTYSLLHSLEPRSRATVFMMVGVAGTLLTRARGAEFSLLFVLILIGIEWARTSKRSAYAFISVCLASALLFGAAVATVGAERIWNFINRKQSAEGIASASGRTDVWRFVVHYCISHPLGMGYIAGFRDIFREYFELGIRVNVTGIGNAHNSYVQVLADAGWLALALYLILMVRITALGWRFAKMQTIVASGSGMIDRHAMRCALALLIMHFVQGFDAADAVIPLRTAFYIQNIIVAIILGDSTRLLVASRARNYSIAK